MFRFKRQIRYQKLIDAHCLPFEASALSDLTAKEAPYLAQLMKERKAIYDAVRREAEFNGWSKTRFEREYRDVVKQEYIDKGWTKKKQVWRVGRTDYGADIWKLFRGYRKDYIRQHPDWSSPTTGKRRLPNSGLMISKGDVKGQRQRYEDKIRKDPERWQRYLEQKARQKTRARERQKREEH